MSVICPKTGQVCCDDLCNGGTCVITGSEPLEECPECGALVDSGEPCECEWEDFDEHDYDGEDD